MLSYPSSLNWLFAFLSVHHTNLQLLCHLELWIAKQRADRTSIYQYQVSWLKLVSGPMLGLVCFRFLFFFVTASPTVPSSRFLFRLVFMVLLFSVLGTSNLFFLTLRGLGPLAPFLFFNGGPAAEGDVGVESCLNTVGCSSCFSACRRLEGCWTSYFINLTLAFVCNVMSLGGSRTTTNRLIWTIGVANTVRSWTRSGCDWVVMT